MNLLRLTIIATVMFPGAQAVSRDDSDEDHFKSGAYTIKFPGNPSRSFAEAESSLGKVKVFTSAYATPKGNVYLVSFCDLPAAAAKPDNLKALFEGIREGIAGKEKEKGESAVKDKEAESEFGLKKKCPYHEFTFKKEDQFVKLWAVVRDERLYQVAVYGSLEFVKDADAYFNSFKLTK